MRCVHTGETFSFADSKSCLLPRSTNTGRESLSDLPDRVAAVCDVCVCTETIAVPCYKVTGMTRHGVQLRCWLLVGCLMSQQHASVSQGRTCPDNLMCCHIETEVADPTFYPAQSQYTGTRPTSLSAELTL